MAMQVNAGLPAGVALWSAQRVRTCRPIPATPTAAHLHRQLAAVGVVQHAALQRQRLAQRGAVALHYTDMVGVRGRDWGAVHVHFMKSSTASDEHRQRSTSARTSGYTARPVCGDPARCSSIQALKRCGEGWGSVWFVRIAPAASCRAF